MIQRPVKGIRPSVADPGYLRCRHGAAGPEVLVGGDWTLAHYRTVLRQVEQTRLDGEPRVDLGALERLDTAGATLLARLLGPERVEALARTAPELSAERRNLLQAVAAASERARATPEPTREPYFFGRLTIGLGAQISHAGQQLARAIAFTGLVLAAFAASALRPWRWRPAAVSRQLQHTALEALPIVALLTFAVGAVIAVLGITVLGRFGAGIFTVDLVAYAFLREFGVVLTAILLAGRSASAFTAQIGSMKANEEIDAMRAQGLSPIEMLVIPRVVALLIAVPVLSFVAVVCGLAGGGLVTLLNVDVPAGRIISLYSDISLRHYLAGLAKAPVFAFVIAIIGCLEGLKCSASAQSVGTHTTSAVVQSIFWVIILNAVAALIYVEIGW
ncbi:ABC transporter permease [Halorhodospira halophila]|nr:MULTISPECIES: ABC transporter permease [Halorhodospira]MBK5944156.1 ABC transporter permease [Halorhodospira halophila]